MAGEAFHWYRAAKWCYLSHRYRLKEYTTLDIQSIVCNAHSLEVYIKAILAIKDGIPDRGIHDCYQLFMKLPPDLIADINSTFSSAIAHSETLDSFLKKTGNRFLTFRYRYERKEGLTINYPLSWTATEVLHNTLMDLAADIVPDRPIFPKFSRYSSPKKEEMISVISAGIRSLERSLDYQLGRMISNQDQIIDAVMARSMKGASRELALCWRGSSCRTRPIPVSSALAW